MNINEINRATDAGIAEDRKVHEQRMAVINQITAAANAGAKTGDLTEARALLERLKAIK